MDNNTSFFLTVSSFCVALILSSCSSDSSSSVTGVCKSCKPYFVRGEWHTPQKHYDYDEVGLASWYGPGFHGKPKPHGEPFDQFEMTAAHKTLPIPTIVKVTNLENGKSTKVLIDDRGPFVYEGRIIDLSIAAAKEIGVYKKGTAQVRVTALAKESDQFANHLKQYRNARCPNGRRWVKIFQQDLANDDLDLKPTVHTGGDCGFANHHTAQKLVYQQPQPPKPVQTFTPQARRTDNQANIVQNPKVDHLLSTPKIQSVAHKPAKKAKPSKKNKTPIRPKSIRYKR
ncbi:MAG: Endolytic peptidoglycan transglycosylase RlpA [Holosporales bacterium]